MYDLNTLIPSNPNLTLTLGATIDDAGVIGGYGFDETAGTNPAVVLLPGWLIPGHEASATRLAVPETTGKPVPQSLKDRRLRRSQPN